MYLVVGATGRTGQFALKALAKTGAPVRATSRRPVDPAKAGTPNVQWICGALSDPDFLEQAAHGIDGIYLALGNNTNQEAQELAIVEAAKQAGVRKIVKLSGPTAGPTSPIAIARMHGRIEERIVALGMAYTFLRPFAFMQNLENQIDPLVRIGRLFGSTGKAALNMVDARDVGEVAAAALLKPELDGSVLDLTGDEAVSYYEVAKRMNKVSRHRFKYVNRAPQIYERELGRQGIPDWTIEHILEIQKMTRETPETPNRTVQTVLRRPPRQLDPYLEELVGKIVAKRREPLFPVSFGRLREKIAGKLRVPGAALSSTKP